MKQALVIAPSDKHLSGTVELDGSKSISNRALIIQALCPEAIELTNLSESDDTNVLVHALTHKPEVIDVGAAGTTLRFLCAWLSTQPGTYVLTGSQRMTERPVGILVEALRTLGANIEYLGNPGYPPLKITGTSIEGGEIFIAANISSQFLSALLMVAPVFKQGLTLNLLTPLVSEPYLNMTLRLMKYFGVNHQKSGQSLYIPPQKYIARPFEIEADWSAASYFFALAALSDSADLLLPKLYAQSLQGDSVIQELMSWFGVFTRQETDGIRLIKTTSVLPDVFHYNFIKCPDIAQTMAVLCAALRVPANMKGLSTLKIKETDRTAALQTELKKVNARFTSTKNSGTLTFPKKTHNHPTPIAFDTYHDHRMAMSFAILTMVEPSGVVINNPEVVSKSFPGFWNTLRRLDFQVQVRDL
ncbi:MAG: 3-phosphoshikimate 1-carboxyvinyltransferase [Sphingobacteriales bacterium]|nr:MAG: 3-phosphoshikimate 1-carboxyvinyltransferase [Sphingobacteriales bacterium]